MASKNESSVIFRRINSLQLGLIPLHLYLSEYIYTHPIKLVKISIPLEAVYTSLFDTFSLQLVVADSFRDNAYLLLFLLTAFFSLAFMNYTELCLRVEHYGERAPKPRGFSIAITVYFFLLYLYFFDTLSTTIPLEEFMGMKFGTISIKMMVIGNWGVILLSLIPVILMLLPPIYISDLLQMFVEATFYRDNGSSEPFTKTINFYLVWLFVLLCRIYYIGFLATCPFARIGSWRWALVICMTLCTIIFISWLFFDEKIYQLKFYQFCLDIQLDWNNRDSWAEKYHSLIKTFKENKKELAVLKNRANNHSHHDSDIIMLLKLGNIDPYISSELVENITAPLVKKDLNLYKKISQICDVENQKVLFTDTSSYHLKEVDEQLFSAMIERLLIFCKEIGAPDSPIIITAPNEENRKLSFSIQIALNSSVANSLSKTLDFLQDSDAVISPDICCTADSLILSKIYADHNDLRMHFTLVDGQIFRIVFTSIDSSRG